MTEHIAANPERTRALQKLVQQAQQGTINPLELQLLDAQPKPPVNVTIELKLP